MQKEKNYQSGLMVILHLKKPEIYCGFCIIKRNRYKTAKNLEKVAIARYSFGKNIPSIWNKEEEPNQIKALVKFIEEKNPDKIGLNFSDHFALADGIVKTDYELFINNLPSVDTYWS